MNWAEFKRGATDIAPMSLAYMPIALLWGTIAASKGLSPMEALFMSVGLYSGAAQFVAMDIWLNGLPLWLMVLTIFTVGLRHVLMSASMSRHISDFPKSKALLLLFMLTDEAWAMIERRALHYKVTPSYFLGVGLPIWPSWFAFSFIGAWLGRGFGDGKAIGLDFAFAAMFIAVIAGFWKGPRSGAVIALSAGAAVVAKYYLPGAWYILVGGIFGMLAAALLYREGETT